MTGKLGIAGVGIGTGAETDGIGGAPTAGRSVAGDSGSGRPVGSEISTPSPGTISPPTTSPCEPLAGLAVGARSDPFAGEAVGFCAGAIGPSRSAATAAPPSSAPAIAIAIAIATSRGHVARAYTGARRGRSVALESRPTPFERMASATASARLDAPNLPNALARCQFTVLSEIPRVPAISLLVRPSATRSRISRWRGLNCDATPGWRAVALP